MRRFDHQHLFENEIKKGINLFLGAGFSILAANKGGLNLPVGNSLNDLVKEKFNMDKSSLNLSQISTILANSKKQEFYSFLREVFTVSDFDKDYFNVDKLNPKNIYTTNIDDLIYKIYEGNEEKYINDVTYHGEILEDLAINFSA